MILKKVGNDMVKEEELIKLTRLLEELSDLIYLKDNVRYTFFNRDSIWFFGHKDTPKFDRSKVFLHLKDYLPGGTELRIWESTHSQIQFPPHTIEFLEKFLEEKSNVESEYLSLEVGKTYRLKEYLTLSTRIDAEEGSVIKVLDLVHAYGGPRLLIGLVSGRFAISFYPEIQSKITRNKFYELNDLLERVEFESPEDFQPIHFDCYHGSRVKCEEIKS